MVPGVTFFQVEILKISNSMFSSLKMSTNVIEFGNNFPHLMMGQEESVISDLQLCKSYVQNEENRKIQTSLGPLCQNSQAKLRYFCRHQANNTAPTVLN